MKLIFINPIRFVLQISLIFCKIKIRVKDVPATDLRLNNKYSVQKLNLVMKLIKFTLIKQLQNPANSTDHEGMQNCAEETLLR